MSGSWLGLDPATYAVSPLHAADRTFRETNCYADLWIEILHAVGVDAASAMAFTVAIDFEGDQWTFFKPPQDDIEALCGIEVHEMQLYRPVIDHALEQLAHGRTMTIEVDSFYLPDTAGTAYREAHVKSSIAIEALDAETEQLTYFHGAGLWRLSGEDFRGVFRLGGPFSDDVLAPYVEVIRRDAGPCLQDDDLRHAAAMQLARHLRRRPRTNPWRSFGDRLAGDLPTLLAGSDAGYHAYAFATVRQSGAAFECARSFAQWLGPDDPAAQAAAAALGRQVDGAKALLFRLARRRPFDPSPAIDALAEAWDEAMAALERVTA